MGLFGPISGALVSGHPDNHIGGKGRDLMEGTGANDFMLAGKGDDVLKGGGGNNKLEGGKGNDRYVIEHGSQNTIKEQNGDDTLVLDGNREDYDISFRGNDMLIESKDGRTSVVIENQIGGPDIEHFEFTGKPLPGSDGQAPTSGQGSDGCGCGSSDDVVIGGPGNDHIYGGPGDDIIYGDDRPFALRPDVSPIASAFRDDD